MRRALIAVALGSAFLGAPAAPAAATSAFDNLTIELEARRDNDFGGVLDAAKKKQQKGVLKCLALIAKPSSGAMNDLKTFSSVAKQVEKAYPIEMGEGPGGLLFELVQSTLNSATSGFFADLSSLQTAVGTVVPSPAYLKAAKFLKAAIAASDKPVAKAYFPTVAKNRLKAWKLAQKGLLAAQGAAPLIDPFLTLTVDVADLTGTQISWQYHSVSHLVTLSVSGTDAMTGDTHSLMFSAEVVPGETNLNILNGIYTRNTAANGQEDFDFSSGNITVATLDLAGHVFEGSFEGTVIDLTEIPISGSFRASWFLEVFAD